MSAEHPFIDLTSVIYGESVKRFIMLSSSGLYFKELPLYSSESVIKNSLSPNDCRAISSSSIEARNVAALISKIPENPNDIKVKITFLWFRIKPILAKFSGVSFLLNFLVFNFSFSVVVDMRTASMGEMLAAILIGLRIDRTTDNSVNMEITTIIANVLSQFQPLGTSTYPIKQPTTIPNGIEVRDNCQLSLFTMRLICFWVMPITLKRPYSLTFPTTEI
ncbi:MAG: hypothetical protein [Bacteriophage sp.]|nr:MAG: hypothetical protein [Bacteriophage sp.]